MKVIVTDSYVTEKERAVPMNDQYIYKT